jgi:hypothetical protein
MPSAVLLALAACLGCVLVGGASAAGSGRAFPIDAENYVTEQLARINPQLQWDPTNFLVDLSGHYANCESVGRRGSITVDRHTPEGYGITGAVDWTEGTRSDVDAVNEYIRTVVDRWVNTRLFHTEITGADRFGCSVRPGCSGRVSVSCLFSNSRPSNIEEPGDQPGDQKALAFTPQQYDMAEQITGNRWDRSHFLENLSGYETDCAMIGTRDWPFTVATQMADRLADMTIVGTYGYAPNRGSTPDALVTILNGFKVISNGRQVGCSLIPDCIQDERPGAQMYVVVSCLYEESR